MATQPQESGPELVEVFETEQESEAMVVHSLLESAGIESVVASLDAPQDVLPGVGGVVIRVNAEDADEARQVIEDYRNSAESEDPVDEADDQD